MSNLSSLIDNPMLKSNRVIRYSGIYQAEPETLSEHVLSVQIMSYLCARKLIQFGESINLQLVLEKSLFHDIDEVITGDIPRPTKYATPESKEVFDTVAMLSLKRIPLIDDDIIELWKNAKDQTKEGFLIRFTDLMDVYEKIILEIGKLNNYEFSTIVLEYLKMFESTPWEEMLKATYDKQESVDYFMDMIREMIKNLYEIKDSDFYKIHDVVRRS